MPAVRHAIAGVIPQEISGTVLQIPVHSSAIDPHGSDGCQRQHTK
jgi:hypothetical protein